MRKACISVIINMKSHRQNRAKDREREKSKASVKFMCMYAFVCTFVVCMYVVLFLFRCSTALSEQISLQHAKCCSQFYKKKNY